MSWLDCPNCISQNIYNNYLANQEIGVQTYAINRDNRNNALLDNSQMPSKFQSSDGNSSFSSGRLIYKKRSGFDYVRQNNKWLIRRKVGKVSGAVEGANQQSSSSYIENKRNLAIGKGSYSKNTNKISFSGVNHNDVNRAKRRARSSGYVAPPKKSLNVYK